MKKGVTNDAPIAIASDGSVIFNASHLLSTEDPEGALHEFLAEGHEMFVGIVVPASYRGALTKDVDNAAADIVGRLGGSVRRRTKPR